MKDQIIKILLESVDLKKLACGVVDEIVEESLRRAVAKSDNKIDDAVMAALWPVIEREIKELINDKLDLAKILSNDEKENT